MTPNPYFHLDDPPTTLYLGDCLDGMRALLDDASVSVVVTSPPYNIGVKYNHYDDRRDHDDYLSWIEAVAAEVHRVLEPDGSFFLNVGSRPSDPWLAWDVANRLRRLEAQQPRSRRKIHAVGAQHAAPARAPKGRQLVPPTPAHPEPVEGPALSNDTGRFVLQNVIIWVKSISIQKSDIGAYPNITGDVSVGHYKPITSRRYLHDNYEYIFHFTKTGNVPIDRLAIGVPYQDKTNIGRWRAAEQDLRCRGNTWFIPYKTIRDRASQRPHPSTFPVQLPEMCLKLHGLDHTHLVLDPFLGLGSTTLAALTLGLPSLGFDIDPQYLAQAKERLERQAASLNGRAKASAALAVSP